MPNTTFTPSRSPTAPHRTAPVRIVSDRVVPGRIARHIARSAAASLALLCAVAVPTPYVSGQAPPLPTSVPPDDRTARLLFFGLPACQMAGTIESSAAIIRVGEPLTVTIRASARCPERFGDRLVVVLVGGIEPPMLQDARDSLGRSVAAFRTSGTSTFILIDVTHGDRPPLRAETPAEYDGLAGHVARLEPGPGASAEAWIRAVASAKEALADIPLSQRPMLLILDRAGVDDDPAPLHGPLHALVTDVRDAAGLTVLIEASKRNPLFQMLSDLKADVPMRHGPEPFGLWIDALLAALGGPIEFGFVGTQAFGGSNDVSVETVPPADTAQGLMQTWPSVAGEHAFERELRLVARFTQPRPAIQLFVSMGIRRHPRVPPDTFGSRQPLTFCVAPAEPGELVCPTPSPTPTIVPTRTATPRPTPRPIPPGWHIVRIPFAVRVP